MKRLASLAGTAVQAQYGGRVEKPISRAGPAGPPFPHLDRPISIWSHGKIKHYKSSL